jgi:HEAT repeat protein
MLGFLGLGMISLVVAATKEEEVAEHLKEAQKGKDAKSRIRAINEVGDLGALQAKLGEPAIPVFMKLLDDKEPKVRVAAALNIVRLDLQKKQEVVDKLTKMLKEDKEETVRDAATRALGLMGPDAKTAVPAIREKLGMTKEKNDKRVFEDALKMIVGKKK